MFFFLLGGGLGVGGFGGFVFFGYGRPTFFFGGGVVSKILRRVFGFFFAVGVHVFCFFVFLVPKIPYW